MAKIQPEILLVYHPTRKSSWANRCSYLGDNYSSRKRYNHRNILQNEIVIEFDDDDISRNLANINMVISTTKLNYSLWYSGGKSFHLHFFINIQGINNLALFKRTVMKECCHYCNQLPDLRLASDNHLIRLEYGIHEGTKKYKTLIEQCENWYEPSRISKSIYNKYVDNKRKRITKVLSSNLADTKEVKFLLTSDKFRLKEDGRERALFALIHILKPSYKTERGLFNFMWDWYKYSGGTQLSKFDVEHKVRYHWNKSYNITMNYLTDLFDEIGIGKEDL